MRMVAGKEHEKSYCRLEFPWSNAVLLNKEEWKVGCNDRQINANNFEYLGAVMYIYGQVGDIKARQAIKVETRFGVRIGLT